MKILVTGGAGYIGSHTCVELLQAGHEVVIADNLMNSRRAAVEAVEALTGRKVPFHAVDVTEADKVDALFTEYAFDGVIHFAGLKAVGESVEKPLDYYRNNLGSTLVLAEACVRYHVPRFVFSSSATVYGANPVPFTEDMVLRPTTNPYGETKAICERILMDAAKAHPKLHVTLLRYFNPVGAHPSGLLGENPRGIPNNLMPYITQVASGALPKLSIYGGDYDTPDGTGVRDYIHVVDLARGHVAALSRLPEGTAVYNLGTGEGTSVLELLRAFQEVNGVAVPYEVVERRPGDLASCYADATKAQRELGWRAELGVRDMVRDAWHFEEKQHR